MNLSVSFATEQRLLRRFHSVSNLVIVAERSDFEVAPRFRRLANSELKETVLSCEFVLESLPDLVWGFRSRNKGEPL